MAMIFLYNLAFLVFGIFYFPVFLVKIRQAEDPKRLWRERWGNLSGNREKSPDSGKTVWLHAVSVGEVNAVEKFVQELLERDRDLDVFLTTVTPTGQRIAKKMEGPRVRVAYFPFDISFVVRRFLDEIQPVAVVLAETEIWPNLLIEVKRRNIPVGVVNARLSERSFKRYRAAGFLLSGLWKKIDFVLAQTREDARRFRELGVFEKSVREMGNMKFDQVELERGKSLSPDLIRERFGVNGEDLVLIAGSTHPGEEKILADVFLELRKRFPALKMIVAPRHIERSGRLLKDLSTGSCRIVLASRKPAPGSFDVLVLDQLGILKELYQIADLVFMGGSLVPHGGQNPVEAARFARAVMHGPHVFNFNMIYRELGQGGGAFLVREPGDLKAMSEKFLSDPALRREAGVKANQIVNRLKGASKCQAEWVLMFLASRMASERKKTDGKSQELFSAGGRGEMP